MKFALFNFGPVIIFFSARVGTDHLYWKSGRVGLSENLDFESRVGSGRVGDLVGRWVGNFWSKISRKKSWKWLLSLAIMIFRQIAFCSLASVRIMNVPVDDMSFKKEFFF